MHAAGKLQGENKLASPSQLGRVDQFLSIGGGFFETTHPVA